MKSLRAYYTAIGRMWLRTIRRRSHKAKVRWTWERFYRAFRTYNGDLSDGGQWWYGFPGDTITWDIGSVKTITEIQLAMRNTSGTRNFDILVSTNGYAGPYTLIFLDSIPMDANWYGFNMSNVDARWIRFRAQSRFSFVAEVDVIGF
jgi:hypothetical protein